jgi:hypothetical protein
MDTQERELWDRLENESERGFRAFESFLALPSGERTLLEAYRRHVDNSQATKPSDTWSRWSSEFAWRERAAAYDDHLASLRRDAYERAVEEEAERQAREVEKARGRANELLTLSYERAMEFLENAQPSDLRFQDVLNIIRLHMDFVKSFSVELQPRHDDDWTEEDDADLVEIWKKIQARKDSGEGAQSPDEQDAESDDSDEERSGESEDEQD